MMAYHGPCRGNGELWSTTLSTYMNGIRDKDAREFKLRRIKFALML